MHHRIQKMNKPDVMIRFCRDGKVVGSVPSSLESLDYCEINIPKRIIYELYKTKSPISMRIEIQQAENN